MTPLGTIARSSFVARNIPRRIHHTQHVDKDLSKQGMTETLTLSPGLTASVCGSCFCINLITDARAKKGTCDECQKALLPDVLESDPESDSDNDDGKSAEEAHDSSEADLRKVMTAAAERLSDVREGQLMSDIDSDREWERNIRADAFVESYSESSGSENYEDVNEDYDVINEHMSGNFNQHNSRPGRPNPSTNNYDGVGQIDPMLTYNDAMKEFNRRKGTSTASSNSKQTAQSSKANSQTTAAANAKAAGKKPNTASAKPAVVDDSGEDEEDMPPLMEDSTDSDDSDKSPNAKKVGKLSEDDVPPLMDDSSTDEEERKFDLVNRMNARNRAPAAFRTTNNPPKPSTSSATAPRVPDVDIDSDGDSSDGPPGLLVGSSSDSDS